jgi:hypothetical protein
MIKKLLLLPAFILFISWTAFAQETAIGQWRHHLPNNRVVSLDEKPGFIYAATPYALLEYDKQYNSIRRYDKVNGLSDFGINVVRYSPQHDLVVMGYQNGTIDVMKNGSFFSISDIRQANIIGSKAINNIYMAGDRAILSCNFGVVIFDLRQFVILDTWFIGPEGSMLRIFDFTMKDGRYYAATEAGLLQTSANVPNPADFRYWTQEPGLSSGWASITQVEVFGDYLLANQSGSGGDILHIKEGNQWRVFNPATGLNFSTTKNSIRSSGGLLSVSSDNGLFIFNQQLQLVGEYFGYLGERVYAQDALVDNDNDIWVADRQLGLVRTHGQQGFESIMQEGPPTHESYGIAHNGRALWVVPGGAPNTWNASGIFALKNNKWKHFTRWQFPQIMDVRDVHSIITDITNPDKAYAASWTGGLIELDVNDGVVAFYDEKNSSLQRRAGVDDWIRVGGMAFDSRNNLWVTNAEATHFLSVKKADGKWLSYPHNGNVPSNDFVHRIVVDNHDQKWVALLRGGGVIVFKEESLDNNQSINIRRLGTQVGNGSLPGSRVTAIAKDHDGYIWVGTTEGVAVFYSPQNALRQATSNFDAQSIIVVQDGFAARLFDGETINTIFVDGSNKKWFGTLSSGAFLLSADGRETVMHFNRSNSPLPSDNILDISVDPQSGEVFFATDRGLVSYRGFATEGGRQHSDVYAFPNPVRPGYAGYIAIRGLVTNARVKITDINGNLVHDGWAEGGQFVWNGIGLNGQRPGSGVYLVFSTNPDGSETVVTKILYVK